MQFSVSSFSVSQPTPLYAGKRQNVPGIVDVAVIPCFGVARQKLPYVQALAGDGNWAGNRLSGFRWLETDSCRSSRMIALTVVFGMSVIQSVEFTV